MAASGKVRVPTLPFSMLAPLLGAGPASHAGAGGTR